MSTSPCRWTSSRVGVGWVQSRGRLVEYVQRVGAVGALEFGSELDSLGLASGQLCRGLPQPEVAQPDVTKNGQRAQYVVLAGEELVSLVYAHRQDLGDIAVAPGDLQRAVLVAGSVAFRAGRVDAGQEQQLDHHEALALAGRAPARGDVEREPPGVVVTPARFGRGGKNAADMVEQASVGGHVRARRAADGLLVDGDHAAQAAGVAGDPAVDRSPVAREQQVGVVAVVAGRAAHGTAQVSIDECGQGLADQARLPRAGDPGNRGQAAERKGDRHVVQVVAVHFFQPQPAGGLPR